MVCKALEKNVVRLRLASIEMESFQDQALAALGRAQTYHRGDDCSVAVPPENCALNAQRIQNQKRLLRGAAMKVQRQRSGKTCRPTVAGTVGNQQPHMTAQCLDLPVDRVHAVAPASMQEHERRTAAHIPIVNGDG